MVISKKKFYKHALSSKSFKFSQSAELEKSAESAYLAHDFSLGNIV